MRVNYEKVKNGEEAFLEVSSRLKDGFIDELSQFELDISESEKDKVIVASGRGIKLISKFEKSYADIELELPILMLALKPIIMSKIENEMKKVL